MSNNIKQYSKCLVDFIDEDLTIYYELGQWVLKY